MLERFLGPKRKVEMMPVLRPTDAILKRIEDLSSFERFSPEARAALLARGYRIVPLTGRSIASLRKEGFRFDADSLDAPGLHTTLPQTEALTSAHTEVAIKPVFELSTHNKNMSDQIGWLQAAAANLSIPDAELRLASMPDMVDAAYTVYEMTADNAGKNGFRIFGEYLGRNMTRTSTSVEGFERGGWIVGNHDSGYGLSIRSFPKTAPARDVGVLGVVYPVKLAA